VYIEFKILILSFWLTRRNRNLKFNVHNSSNLTFIGALNSTVNHHRMFDHQSVPYLLIEKWVCCSTMVYHYASFPATLILFQTKNSVKSAPASTELTKVSHWNHNANRHPSSSRKRNGAQRRTKVSIGTTMMQALELQLGKRYVSGRSDVKQ